MAGDKLEKLLAQRKAIRENAQKRKNDTRRKILAGAAVLDEAAGKPEYRAELYKLLGRFLVRAEDRALFGLWELPKVEDEDRRSGD